MNVGGRCCLVVGEVVFPFCPRAPASRGSPFPVTVSLEDPLMSRGLPVEDSSHSRFKAGTKPLQSRFKAARDRGPGEIEPGLNRDREIITSFSRWLPGENVECFPVSCSCPRFLVHRPGIFIS